ncbi:MAG: hypothetical protein HY647_00570 [Acidobacteria bacterium]|nr:hypothetical protein [Acidobacteriota bacterium]
MSHSSEFQVRLKRPHPHQEAFLRSRAKHKVIRAGRRAGKTTGMAIAAVQSFLAARRVLYAAPTDEQISQFWREVKTALALLIDAGVFYKNETEHIIERAGTSQRIKAKTAWNADTLRGDYADLLILDEWQLMDETVWDDVGAPMLLDNNGDAIFVYTPPSIRSQALSKARDPRYAAKKYKMALAEQEEAKAEGRLPRWEAFHFRSQDNPHISQEALREISKDMSNLSFRQEILAEDVEDPPGALWTRALIESTRIYTVPPFTRVAVGVDPPGGAGECGIVVVGVGTCACKGTAERHAFVLQDRSLKAAPDKWAKEVVAAYKASRADRVYGEKNFGGDMVESTIRTVDRSISYKSVTASRGKAVRAEPISALYEQGKVHHVGRLDALEEEMVSWQPEASSWSPNRVDALVWVLTELMLGEGAVQAACVGMDPPERRSIWERWPEVGYDRPQIERPWPSIWERDDYGKLFMG